MIMNRMMMMTIIAMRRVIGAPSQIMMTMKMMVVKTEIIRVMTMVVLLVKIIKQNITLNYGQNILNKNI